MRRLLLLLAASGALVVAGCGDSNDSNDSKSSGGGSYGSGAPAQTAAASTDTSVEIHLKNFAFSPSSQTVKVGTKVTWINDDAADHNVTGGDIKSGNLGQGKTFGYTADKPGTISYVCTLHSGMTGTLNVTS